MRSMGKFHSPDGQIIGIYLTMRYLFETECFFSPGKGQYQCCGRVYRLAIASFISGCFISKSESASITIRVVFHRLSHTFAMSFSLKFKHIQAIHGSDLISCIYIENN